MHRSSYPARAAFTLVELAVVLVIIALIVGGVLVGRDLIRTSQIRGTAAAVEKYNAGGGTFRTKYAALPGDILAYKATQFGFQTRSGADGQGDGDARLENIGTSGAPSGLGGETALYWRDLSSANLISYRFDTATENAVDSSGFVAPASEDMALYLPGFVLRNSAFMHIYGGNGVNYYHFGSFVSGATTGAITWGNGLTPYEALGIDEKLDDGTPSQGTVRAVTAIDALDAGASAAPGVCVNTDFSPPTYNLVSDSFGGTVSCQLRIRAAF